MSPTALEVFSPLLFRSSSGELAPNVFTVANREYQTMTIQLGAFVFTTLLGSGMAASAMQGQAETPPVTPPPEQTAPAQKPDESADETEENKKKKKKQQEEQQEK